MDIKKKIQQIFTKEIVNLNELPLYVYSSEFLSADAQKELQLERFKKIMSEVLSEVEKSEN